MGKGRLEAFSDGVIAIIITIMVLEFKRPDHASLAALAPLWPHIAIYALSFVYVGIYWSNHHHLFHAVRTVSGAILWANLHLLFWLSLLPFVTDWMGENHGAALAVALYGVVLLMNGLAYNILSHLLVKHEGPDSVIARAIGKDRKTLLSVLGYLAAIGLSVVLPPLSLGIYAAIALVWLIPDRRIERALRA
jgi:uncharacterized membrane protein